MSILAVVRTAPQIYCSSPEATGQSCPKTRNPKANTKTNGYREAKRRVSQVTIEGRSNRTKYEYDVTGNLVGRKDANGYVHRFSYDIAGRLLVASSPELSGETRYYWDEYEGMPISNGRLVAVEIPNQSTFYEFDSFGRQTAEERTRTSYVVGEENVEVTRVEWEYDKNGNVRAMVYPTGLRVIYVADPSDVDRVGEIKYESPNGEESSLVRIPNSHPVDYSLSFPNGIWVNREHDLAGRLKMLSVLDENGGTKARQYSYLPNGNLREILDVQNPTSNWQFDYDSVGRLKAEHRGLQLSIEYGYDLAGNRTSKVNRYHSSGVVKSENYMYQLGTNLLYSIETANVATSLLSFSSITSDEVGKLAKDKNAQNLNVRIVNDLIDFLFSTRRFLRQAYGSGSFSESKSAFANKQTSGSLAPSELHRRKISDTLILTKEALAAGSLTIDDIQLEIEASTRLQKEIDLFTDDVMEIPADALVGILLQLVSTFTAEDLELLNELLDLGEDIPDDGEIPGDGELPGDWGDILTQSRLLSGLGAWTGTSATFGMQPTERVKAIKVSYRAFRSNGGKPSAKLVKGLSKTKSDKVLLKLIARASGDAADSLVLEGSTSAMLLSASTTQSSGNNFGYNSRGDLDYRSFEGREWNYTYSPEGRLVAVANADGTNQKTYSYDHVGRRIGSEYNTTLAYDSGIVSASKMYERWTFDRGAEPLTYTRQNMISPEAGEESIENYIYLNGVRVAKIVMHRRVGLTRPDDDGSGGGGSGGGGSCCAATAIAYDGKTGQCDIASFSALESLRRFRSEVLSGTSIGEWVIRFYYRDFSPIVRAVLLEYPEIRGVSRLLLRGVGTVSGWIVPEAHAALPDTPYEIDTYWYITDHLGATLALVDETNNYVYSVDRDAFGNVIQESGQIDDPFIFPGQFWDEQAQLAYNWNRWYSPDIGRYMQADPLLAQGIVEPLAYSYAENNPVSYIDFTGLLVELCKRPLSGDKGNFLYNNATPSVPTYHEFVRLNGVSYGFGPSSGNKVFDVPGSVTNNDVATECTKVTCVDEAKLQANMQASAISCQNYNLLSSNCQHWAKRMLKQSRIRDGKDEVNQVCCD